MLGSKKPGEPEKAPTVVNLYLNYPFQIVRPTGMSGQLQWAASDKFMQADLARSGLEPMDMWAHPRILNIKAPADYGYSFPYFSPEGEVLHDGLAGITNKMHRTRWHYPNTLSTAQAKSVPKYDQPSIGQVGREAATAPYLNAMMWKCAEARGWDGMVFLVEGEKKATALMKRTGVPTIGIGGCENWRHHDVDHRRMAHPWIVRALDRLKVKRLVVIPDGDVERPQIQRAYNGLLHAVWDHYNMLRGDDGAAQGVDEVVVEIVRFTDKIDDWLVAHPDVDALEATEGWERFDVDNMIEDVRGLIRTYNLQTRTRGQNEVIVPNENNILRLMRRHPYFQDLKMNKDNFEIVGEFADITPLEVTAHFQSHYNMDVTRERVEACFYQVAEQKGFYGILDWLKGLEWDGVPRLDNWLVRGAQAVCKDHIKGHGDYVRQASRRWLVGAVARRFDPGCVMDFMLILQGKQGIGKSSLFRIMFGHDNTLEFSRKSAQGKDEAMNTHMAWCVSDEELDNLNNSQRNDLKALITIRTDQVRLPYAKKPVRMPRQFVWAGSTNDSQFLPEDHSGHRRFVVIEVGQVDFKYLEKWREQLWAEAVVAYQNGEEFANVDKASDMVEHYVQSDPIVDMVVAKAREMERMLAEGRVGKDRLYRGEALYQAALSKGMGEKEAAEMIKRGTVFFTMQEFAMLCGRDRASAWEYKKMSQTLQDLGWVRLAQAKASGQHFNSVFFRV